MDPEATAAVTPHLLAGEMLLWSGRPRDTSPLRNRAIAVVFFGGLAITLSRLSDEFRIAQSVEANAIILGIVVIGLIAEAMVFHAYLSSTFYGVTNLRAIIISGLREQQVATVLLDKLNSGMVRLRRIGNTLELRGVVLEISRDPHFTLFGNPSVLARPERRIECYRLVGLENAGEVYRIILDAADKFR